MGRQERKLELPGWLTAASGRTARSDTRETRAIGRRNVLGPYTGFFKRLAANRGALAGLIVLVLLLLVSVFSGRLAPYDPIKVGTGPGLSPPSFQHLMGTDQYGRDILSRTMYGGRATLSMSLIGVLIAAATGVISGLIAGYLEGWIDSIVTRLVDVMLAFPGIMLTLTVVAVLGPGLANVQIAVGVSLIPAYVRLVRGAVFATKHNDYVEAARAVGCRPLRVMFRHILPNIMTPILVLSTTAIGWAIIIATSMNFLGLGVSPPEPEWGADLTQALTYLSTALWMAFAGLAIVVAVIAVNLFGDGLEAALDPYKANV